MFNNGAGINLGFWPHKIFTNLGNAATLAEWGGEVFSPPKISSPPAGSGHVLISDEVDTARDAFSANSHIVVNNTIMDPPDGVLEIGDDSNYSVFVEGDVGGDIHYLIFYGGPGGST